MLDFYVTLPSNAVLRTFSARPNTSASYRIRLPHEIRLSDDAWEVALVELQYPHSWNNLTEEVDWSVGKNNTLMIKMKNGNSVSISLAPGYYDNIECLLAMIRKACEASTKWVDLSGSIKDNFWFDLDFLRQHVIFKCIDNTNLEGVMISKQLQYLLGFDKIYLKSSSKITRAKYPPALRGGIDSLFVYCDIISPQIIGDSLEPLLRVVPITGAHGDNVDKVFLAPHYVPVLQKQFQSIEISINTDQDEPIKFQFGKSFVKLHFRKHMRLR
jgi:hypothetical protein